MPTNTMSIESPFTSPCIPDCPVCHGTGIDTAFCSPCNCLPNLLPSARAEAIRQMLGDDGRLSVGMPTQPHPSSGRSHTDSHANRYAGKCVACAQWVEAGEGFRVFEGQGWSVRHRPGQCAAVCTECGNVVHRGTGLARRGENGEQLVRHVHCPRPAPAAQSAAQPVQMQGLDLTAIPHSPEHEAMWFGVPGGDTRLKVRIRFPQEGKWAGWVFVDDGAAYGYGRRYGSQKPGKRYQGDIVDELAAILADVPAALRRYAELTSRCGVCNTKLENEESVRIGIGPICRGRLGL